jgi:uncharacterized protein YabE (DUF348 family)
MAETYRREVPKGTKLTTVQAIIVAVNEDGARRVAGLDGEGVAEAASGAP